MKDLMTTKDRKRAITGTDEALQSALRVLDLYRRSLSLLHLGISSGHKSLIGAATIGFNKADRLHRTLDELWTDKP